MDVRSLGERDANYTNSSIRQMKQKNSAGKNKNKGGKNSGGGMVAAGLIAGAGVGVLAGMLLAPKTGRDLRRQVTDSATKLSTQASSLFNSSREKVTSWTGKGNKTASPSRNLAGTSGNITDPHAKTASGRDIANDTATSITM